MIHERLEILKISFVNSFQIDTAYFAESWAGILSTITYTISSVLLLNVLYGNLKTIGTYSHNEMLLLLLVSQLCFYVFWGWSVPNIDLLIKDINKGSLDLVLVKPLPVLFYVTLRRISLLRLFRDSLVPVIILSVLINWHTIHITFSNFIAACVIFIFGQIALNAFQFLMAMPAFLQGEGGALLRLTMTLSVQRIPFEGLPNGFKVFFTVIVPNLLATGICTSVLLGKLNAGIMVAISLAIAIVFFLGKRMLWQIGLKNYTSASS